MQQMIIAVACLLLAQLLGGEALSCIGWRSTRGCNPYGPRDSKKNFPCTEKIAADVSGYCVCEDNVHVALSGCGHETFTCKERCTYELHELLPALTPLHPIRRFLAGAKYMHQIGSNIDNVLQLEALLLDLKAAVTLLEGGSEPQIDSAISLLRVRTGYVQRMVKGIHRSLETDRASVFEIMEVDAAGGNSLESAAESLFRSEDSTEPQEQTIDMLFRPSQEGKLSPDAVAAARLNREVEIQRLTMRYPRLAGIIGSLPSSDQLFFRQETVRQALVHAWKG